ncbi:MAG: ECF transporter S component [Acidimicrobiia bacterium]
MSAQRYCPETVASPKGLAGEPARQVPSLLVYVLVAAVGTSAFLYPFWLPSEALPNSAHSGDAPLLSAAVAAMVVMAIVFEVRGGSMNAAGIAVLGVLSAFAGLLRLIDLPGGGSGMFFLVILAAASLGPRFGLLLGITAMAVSAVVTGGVGPWLPYQMLALGFMGASSGALAIFSRRLPLSLELVLLVAWSWVWGFVYGAIMNLWFWPFMRGLGPLSWQPGMGFVETLKSYWRFYVSTSLAWDAAGAISNAVLVAATGIPVLATLRRFAARVEPPVVIEAIGRSAKT